MLKCFVSINIMRIIEVQVMKFNIKKHLVLLLFASALFFNFANINAEVAGSAVTKPSTAKTATVSNYISVSPLAVVENPEKYLNKNITFEAEFVSFSGLGLDYPPAKREAEKYISILIRRDNAKENVIPLSEMKIFITRELAEKNVDIETGDKIKIEGKVFSTALGDPWVDAKTLKIISTKKKENSKKN